MFSTKEQNLKTIKYSTKKVSKVGISIRSKPWQKWQSYDFRIWNLFIINSRPRNTSTIKYFINEISTNTKKMPVKKKCNTKLRLCKHITEDISHIISSCPAVSVRYYWLIKRDVIPKTFLKALILKIDPTNKFKYQQDLEYIYRSKIVNFGGIFSFKLQQI